MKRFLKNRRIMIGLLIIVLLILVLIFPNSSYTYNDMRAPSTTYAIKINKYTKLLKGKFTHTCSALDCETSINKCNIKLTNDEYKKIRLLWNKKEELSPILERLCDNNKVFYKSFEDSFEENQEEYNKMDSNSDGKVTSREFANQWLVYAINGQ